MGNMAHEVCLSVLQQLFGDETGAAAIEYGLIIAGIALAIVGAVFAVGDDLSSVFDLIASTVATGEQAAN